ncbi:MAG: aspartate ammonia-lyase, partial [Methanobacteriota archaeon]
MVFRVEKDFLGEKPVPSDAYYGIHTVRSKETFNISGLKTHKELISALAKIKIACARANKYFGLIDHKRA